MDTSFSDAHQASPVSFTMLSGMPAAEYVFKDTLEATGFTYDPQAATMLLIDSPTGFALTTLELLGERDHLRVVVAMGNTCPEYWEDVWELQPDILLVGIDLHHIVADAIRRASNGQRYRIVPGESTPLTLSERRVLRGLVHGWSDQRIAHQLGLTPKTVRNTLSRVYRKLDVPDRVAAALRYWGMEHVLT